MELFVSKDHMNSYNNHTAKFYQWIWLTPSMKSVNRTDKKSQLKTITLLELFTEKACATAFTRHHSLTILSSYIQWSWQENLKVQCIKLGQVKFHSIQFESPLVSSLYFHEFELSCRPARVVVVLELLIRNNWKLNHPVTIKAANEPSRALQDSSSARLVNFNRVKAR